METIGDRLKRIIQERGISARALSLQAGMSESYVGQLIRGDIGSGISHENAKALADVAGVSWVWLLSGEDGAHETDVEEASKVETAIRILRPMPEEMEAHLRDRANAVAFNTTDTFSSIFHFLETEQELFRRQQSGASARTAEPEAEAVRMRDGIARLPKKSRRR